MTIIGDAIDQLAGVLGSIEGLNLRELGEDVNPPTLVIGPPRLEFEVPAGGPTSATFLVYLIVPIGDHVVEQLLDLVPQVASIIDEHTDGTVTTADPATFIAGGEQLPCYEITVEWAL